MELVLTDGSPCISDLVSNYGALLLRVRVINAKSQHGLHPVLVELQ